MDRMSTTRVTWRYVVLMPHDGKRSEAIERELYASAVRDRGPLRVSDRLAGEIDLASIFD